MKTEKNILIAFVLNLAFSVFECIGGMLTGSVAIISDAVHDLGDAVSIGLSYFLERKSRKQPDDVYTYGNRRFSLLGSLVTTVILLFGSMAVIYNAIRRIYNPVPIDYSGMLVLAILGVAVNFLAAVITRDGDSLNQRAVNLHMLEDVLGWLLVLVGAIIMRFTDFAILDSLLSIGVSVFIGFHAIKNFKTIENIFLEKIPDGMHIPELKEHLCGLAGVLDVHHMHIRSIDGSTMHATMHIVTDGEHHAIKEEVRKALKEHRIVHATLELEAPGEHCQHRQCRVEAEHGHHHHHH